MIRLRSILTLLLLLVFQQSISAVLDYNVFFKNKTFVPIENHGVVDDLTIQKNTFEGNVFAFVQFYEIPTLQQRQELSVKGIDLGDYIKRYAYSISLSVDKFTELKNLSFVRSVFFQSAFQKQFYLNFLSTTLGERIELNVVFYKGTPQSQATEYLKSQITGLVYTQGQNNLYTINISKYQIQQLLEIPFVFWVEEKKEKFIELGVKAVNLHRANVLTSTLAGRRGLSGNGVNIGTWDGSGVGEHIDFANRLTNIEPFVAGVEGTHSTNVSGIIAGRGNRNPLMLGMAPRANIFAWNYGGPLVFEMDTGTVTHNLVLINHSYGFGSSCATNGSYDIWSLLYDSLTIVHPQLLMMYAAGNSRGGNCIAGGYRTVLSSFQSTKNGLTVGNLTSTDGNSSDHSYGPTLDGRLKPEICAMGTGINTTNPGNVYGTVSGTSFSAPGITGTAALLYEHYRNLNSGNNPAAHTIKAFIMNTARDLGNPGPDYRFGFGRINGDRAADIIDSADFVIGNIAHQDSLVQSITIAGGTSYTELKFMLAWTDLTPALPAATTLVNDLDLFVIDPNGDTIRPLILDPLNPANVAVEGIDTLNNVEQVVTDNVIVGDYKMVVLGSSIPSGNVDFVLTWLQTEPFIKITHPIGAEKWLPPSSADTQQIISWDGHEIPGTLTIEFSQDSGSTWSTLASGLDSSTRFFVWNTASSTLHTGEAFIRVSSSAGGAFITQNDTPFTIMQTPQNNGPLSLLCSEQVTLFWNPLVPSVEFKVYQLIGEEMVEIGQTSDTFFIVTGLNNGDTYWFAISGVDTSGHESKRSIATSHIPNASNTLPEINPAPTNLLVCELADANFTSTISGNPSPSNQWQLSTDGGTSWSDISGENSNDFTLNGVNPSLDNNLYRIISSNLCGADTSNQAALNIDTIPPKPSILINPLTACGDTIELESDITNPNLQYDWFFTDAERQTVSGLNQPGPITTQWVWPTAPGFKDIFLTLTFPDNNCTNADTMSLNVGCIALPIELTLFKASPFENYVLIEWETINEINNDYFTILKSIDLIHWEEIGIVKGAGNSFEIHSYQFRDLHPIFGVQYYKLKQTDFDGISTNSKAIEVIYNKKLSSIQIRPNPVEDVLYIECPEKINRVSIKSISGKSVFETTTFSNSISLKEIPAGIYFIEIETENRIEVLKVIKQ